jgi:two-component system sensor histidine kinase KdpD
MKTTLLRSVSHDLRSPLTAITTAADGLASDSLSDESRRELASVIRSESARLSRLVDNLLDLTRIQAGSVAPRLDWVSLDEVVRAAIDTIPAPPAGFDVQIDPDLPALNADAAQLERAIANILENGAQYSGDEPVSVRARTVGRLVLLRISDRGPGIPREELERVFEPFHRTREGEGGGSGLGLAIARGFLEANGGRIRAESLPGQGTSFVIQFPLAAPAPAPAS